MRGTVGAAAVWAWADVRARWRSFIVLGVIAGVAAGLALACLVGALRTGTALERLQDQTAASDAVVFSSQAGFSEPDWSTLAERPEVDGLARWALVFGDIEIEDGPDELFFVPVGDQMMNTIDRPVVVEGRMWDPDADDELLVGEGIAHIEGLSVGDTTGFTPLVAADFDATGSPIDGPPQGPRLDMRIVGIIRTPLEPLFVSDGLVLASPGLLANHPDVLALENSVVRLSPETGGMPELLRHLDTDVAPGIPVLDLNAVARRVTTTTDVERTVLLLLAAVIAMAGLVLVGQMISRSALAIGSDARSLEAMGMSRRSVTLAATLAHGLAAAVASVVCVATALAMSSVLPFGLAGRLDPETGLRVDLPITMAGTVALVLLLLGGCFAAAWSVSGAVTTDPPDDTRGLVGWVRRHSSVVVGLGTTMAFRRTRGRRGVAVRPALLGAVIGVLGVAGAVTVDAGLDDALDHPERAGVVWDVTVREGDAGLDAAAAGLSDELVAAVRDEAGVAEVARGQRLVVPVDNLGAPAFMLQAVGDDRSSPIDLTVLDGRAPRAPSEVAIGPQTARALDLEIGDTVTVAGHPRHIVGTALFPTDVHSGFDEGVWLASADEGLLPLEAEDGIERFLAVRLAPGADPHAVMAAIDEIVEPVGGFAVPPERPPELVNLRDVVPLPRWLGAFLALLAVAALLHVLSSSARARARDFAVLRAIGVTRRGTRLALNVQGVAVFLAGLAVGAPLGVAAGRVGWRLIADRVPLAHVSPFAALALGLLVPAALLASQIVAVGPGHRLRKLRPAEVLRTE